VKNTARAAKQAVKTTSRSTKQAVKTADRTVRTAQKTAQATVKATQRTVQAVRATAKAAATTAKAAAKATVAAIKAAIAAIQELIGAIAAGGWVAIVVVLVICLAAFLIASPFGIFFSGEDSGSGLTMPEAVVQLNGEFTSQIEQIQADNPHDTLDLDNAGTAAMISNWNDVLAVYAVRVSTDDTSPGSVAVVTDENLAILREIFWEMNQISYLTESKEHTETVTKEDGSTEEVTTTETILHITVTTKDCWQMADEYGFTEEQREMLTELLKPEYQEMFLSLTGSYQNIALSPQEVAEIMARLPEDLSEERRQVVLTAYQLLGKVNYFWGGKSLVLGWDSRWGTPMEVWAAGSPSTGTVRPYGLDCSGFADWVFYNASSGNYVIGHGGGASAQHSYCTDIAWSEAVPGDLVFYPGDSHVGIVCGFDAGGNVQIIHCASGANNVVVTGKSGFTSIGRPDYYNE
jgi:cell wall-associated NlpC family hydrolase